MRDTGDYADDAAFEEAIKNIDLNELGLKNGNIIAAPSPVNLLVPDQYHFKASVKAESDTGSDTTTNFNLFQEDSTTGYMAQLPYTNTNTKPGDTALEITLKQSFYHDLVLKQFMLQGDFSAL